MSQPIAITASAPVPIAIPSALAPSMGHATPMFDDARSTLSSSAASPASGGGTPPDQLSAFEHRRSRASSLRFAPASCPGPSTTASWAPVTAELNRITGQPVAGFDAALPFARSPFAAGEASSAAAGMPTGLRRARANTMSGAQAVELEMKEAGVYNTFDLAGGPSQPARSSWAESHNSTPAGPDSAAADFASGARLAEAELQGPPPLGIKIVGFNREANGRPRYKIEVRFERQRWNIYKYYTDFYNLRNTLEGSQHHDFAGNLPRKHPIRLKLRMKLSLSKRRAQRREIPFVMHRMQLLEGWLNRLLEHVGPAGLDHARFLDDFFEAFPEEEPYNRSEPRTAHVNINSSMHHVLKSIGVPNDVYYRLWSHGHSIESIATLRREQWVGFGASAVLSCELYRNLFKPQYLLRLQPPVAPNIAPAPASGPAPPPSLSSPTAPAVAGAEPTAAPLEQFQIQIRKERLALGDDPDRAVTKPAPPPYSALPTGGSAVGIRRPRDVIGMTASPVPSAPALMTPLGRRLSAAQSPTPLVRRLSRVAA